MAWRANLSTWHPRPIQHQRHSRAPTSRQSCVRNGQCTMLWLGRWEMMLQDEEAKHSAHTAVVISSSRPMHIDPSSVANPAETGRCVSVRALSSISA
eukprot:538928-Rhodomonas_salina.2